MTKGRRLAQVVAAAVGCAAIAARADAGLVIDIRPTHVNGVAISVPDNGDLSEGVIFPPGPGTTVSLNVYARVRGTNGLDDEGFQSISGVFRTGTGSLLGDLATALVSPFNASGSSPGTQIDADSDGDLDIGPAPNGGTPSSAFWFVRANEVHRDGVRVDENTEEWLIGAMTWTLQDGPSTGPDFFIDFIRRRNAGNPGTNNAAFAQWQEDGSGSASVRNGMSPYAVDGVMYGPEPGGVALTSIAAIGLLARRRRASRARQPDSL